MNNKNTNVNQTSCNEVTDNNYETSENDQMCIANAPERSQKIHNFWHSVRNSYNKKNTNQSDSKNDQILKEVEIHKTVENNNDVRPAWLQAINNNLLFPDRLDQIYCLSDVSSLCDDEDCIDKNYNEETSDDDEVIDFDEAQQKMDGANFEEKHINNYNLETIQELSAEEEESYVEYHPSTENNFQSNTNHFQQTETPLKESILMKNSKQIEDSLPEKKPGLFSRLFKSTINTNASQKNSNNIFPSPILISKKSNVESDPQIPFSPLTSNIMLNKNELVKKASIRSMIKKHLDDKTIYKEDNQLPKKSFLSVNGSVLKDSDINNCNDSEAIYSDEEFEIIKMAESKCKIIIKEDWTKFVFLPSSKFLYCWENLTTLLIVYIILVLPYKFAFVEEPGEAWDIFDYMVDLMFIIDIIVVFFTAYIDDKNEIVISKKKIAFKYQKFWFWLDLMSVFPVELVSQSVSYNILLRFTKLPKLYKIVKATKLFRTIRQGRKKGNNDDSGFRKIHLPPGFERLIFNLISIFLFCHQTTCLKYFLVNMYEDRDSWIYHRNFIDLGPGGKYLTSYYWVVMTVITVGYGDVSVNTTNEKLLAVITMFAGVLFFSFMVGSLFSIINDMDKKSVIYETKLQLLMQIREKYNIDEKMMFNIQDIVRNQVYAGEQDYSKFLSDLPDKYRIKLGYVMYKAKVKGLNILRKKNGNYPQDVVATVGPLLSEVKYKIGDVIYSENDYANEIYFIKSGSIHFVLPKYGNWPYITIKDGNYFGEIDVLLGQTRKIKAVAETNTVQLVLKSQDFNKVFVQDFPQIGHKFFNKIVKRRERQLKAYMKAENYIKSLFELQRQIVPLGFELTKVAYTPSLKNSYLRKLTPQDTFEEIDNECFGPNQSLKKNNLQKKPMKHYSKKECFKTQKQESVDMEFVMNNKDKFGIGENGGHNELFSKQDDKGISTLQDKACQSQFLTGEELFNQEILAVEDTMMDRIDRFSPILSSHEEMINTIEERLEDFYTKCGWTDENPESTSSDKDLYRITEKSDYGDSARQRTVTPKELQIDKNKPKDFKASLPFLEVLAEMMSIKIAENNKRAT